MTQQDVVEADELYKSLYIYISLYYVYIYIYQVLSRDDQVSVS